jgi:hypothetical protein
MYLPFLHSLTLHWQHQRNQRQQNRHQHRFELHPARLLPHLGQFSWIFYLLYLIAQLARTSRRQTYSSLIAPLKETRRCTGEQRKEC